MSSPGHRLALVLRLLPPFIRASRVRPSIPPLFHKVERQALRGQFGGFSVSGIHRCPQTSHVATLIVVQPIELLYSILSIGQFTLDILSGNLDNMSYGHIAGFRRPAFEYFSKRRISSSV